VRDVQGLLAVGQQYSIVNEKTRGKSMRKKKARKGDFRLRCPTLEPTKENHFAVALTWEVIREVRPAPIFFRYQLRYDGSARTKRGGTFGGSSGGKLKWPCRPQNKVEFRWERSGLSHSRNA